MKGIRNLMEEKVQLLERINENLKKSYKDVNEAADIVESNRLLFESLRELEKEIEQAEAHGKEDAEQEKVPKKLLDVALEVRENHEKIQSYLKKEREEAKRYLSESFKKKDVLNNYIKDQREPIFVDKDFS
ncbi:MAG TPA: hypothetical protein DHN33_03485 [Eubacteriaceae bacterium]|nr:hypothetical protein [Eubacteriaceae bacterium]